MPGGASFLGIVFHSPPLEGQTTRCENIRLKHRNARGGLSRFRDRSDLVRDRVAGVPLIVDNVEGNGAVERSVFCVQLFRCELDAAYRVLNLRDGDIGVERNRQCPGSGLPSEVQWPGDFNLAQRSEVRHDVSCRSTPGHGIGYDEFPERRGGACGAYRELRKERHGLPILLEVSHHRPAADNNWCFSNVRQIDGDRLQTRIVRSIRDLNLQYVSRGQFKVETGPSTAD